MSKSLRKKKRRKLSKLLKSAKTLKIRKPIAPPSKVFKTKKQYVRKIGKKVVVECDI